jgi:hypothetical protein
MRLTRRQVLKLAAAQGVLLSLPRAAMAVARVSPGDGFVGAVRLGDELVVASASAAGSRIDFYSADSGARTRRAVNIAEPLVIGAISSFAGAVLLGGHSLVEGPLQKLRAGDYRKVMEDSGEPAEAFSDFPRGRIMTREYDLIPWVATMAPGDAGPVDTTHMSHLRGVVRGFTPNGAEPAVWVAICPEAATFSATAVRAYRGPGGSEITDLSLGTGDVDVASLLSVSDGITAMVSSNDHGLARLWEVTGESRRELRLPEETTTRSVMQLLVVDAAYHVITADHEDGSVRQWRRTGSRWSRVAEEQRNLVDAGAVELELPNR